MISAKDREALINQGWIPVTAKDNGYLVVVFVKGDSGIIADVRKIGEVKNDCSTD